jgi:hypothetical protein
LEDRLVHFGLLTEEKYVSTGSGSPVAYGILEDKYKEDSPVKEMLPVIVKAVNAAMKRDSASGDSFNVTVIDAKGYKDLNDKREEATFRAGQARGRSSPRLHRTKNFYPSKPPLSGRFGLDFGSVPYPVYKTLHPFQILV